ncbi:MAG: hypothetical protein JWN03_5617, partial [Nocardia sp.]|nr:hypothetical protein [Nocardia sp.]
GDLEIGVGDVEREVHREPCRSQPGGYLMTELLIVLQHQNTHRARQ